MASRRPASVTEAGRFALIDPEMSALDRLLIAVILSAPRIDGQDASEAVMQAVERYGTPAKALMFFYLGQWQLGAHRGK